MVASGRRSAGGLLVAGCGSSSTATNSTQTAPAAATTSPTTATNVPAAATTSPTTARRSRRARRPVRRPRETPLRARRARRALSRNQRLCKAWRPASRPSTPSERFRRARSSNSRRCVRSSPRRPVRRPVTLPGSATRPGRRASNCFRTCLRARLGNGRWLPAKPNRSPPPQRPQTRTVRVARPSVVLLKSLGNRGEMVRWRAAHHTISPARAMASAGCGPRTPLLRAGLETPGRRDSGGVA